MCKLNKSKIPDDIKNSLINKSNNMHIYNKLNRQGLLFTTCAVIRKNKIDRKEECEMSLDTEKKDRSYQYGRLLAILEKIEKDTYSKENERETNAIRMQSVFVKRPAYASKVIIEQLNNSYFPKLKKEKPGISVKYERMMGEIYEILSLFEDEYNNPLTENYLLGYYLQKNELYKKVTAENADNKEMEETINE